MIKADLVDTVARKLNISRQEAEAGSISFSRSSRRLYFRAKKLKFVVLAASVSDNGHRELEGIPERANWSRSHPKKSCTSSPLNC